MICCTDTINTQVASLGEKRRYRFWKYNNFFLQYALSVVIVAILLRLTRSPYKQ